MNFPGDPKHVVKVVNIQFLKIRISSVNYSFQQSLWCIIELNPFHRVIQIFWEYYGVSDLWISALSLVLTKHRYRVKPFWRHLVYLRNKLGWEWCFGLEWLIRRTHNGNKLLPFSIDDLRLVILARISLWFLFTGFIGIKFTYKAFRNSIKLVPLIHFFLSWRSWDRALLSFFSDRMAWVLFEQF